MATMYTFALTADLTGAAGVFADTDLDLITINSQTLKTDLGATLSADKATITIPGYGTLTASAATNVKVFTFKASSSAPTGTYSFTESAHLAKWDNLDFSLATSAVTVTGTTKTTKILSGAGADALTADVLTESIIGGAGDDTITAAAGGVAVSFKGGLGADKFVQVGAVNLAVADYNYAEGDTVKQFSSLAAGASLAADGKYIDTNITVTTTAADSAYKVKVTDSTATPVTKEFWTAKTGASSVSFDGTSITNDLVIDVQQAISSQITLGSGSDTATLTGSKVTLTAGKSGGTDALVGFDGTFTGDVLNLKDATLSDLTFGASNNVTIGSGATKTILTDINATGGANGKLLLQENGGTVKKVAYTTVGSSMDMSDSSVADVYLGAASTVATDTVGLDVTGLTSYGNLINFQDTAKYKNVNSIVGGANTGGNSYVGTVSSHDASGATGTTFDLAAVVASSQIWGGSSAKDSIALNIGNGAKDTVWFGTTDGTDTVSGFDMGFRAANDVVKLYDVADLTTLSITGDANNATVKAAAGNTLTMLGVANGNSNAQLKLMDKNGTVKKVAIGTALGATVLSSNADLVIGSSELDNIVVFDNTQTTDVFVNLFDTTKYKNIKDINLTNVTGSHNLAVGSATLASDITLAGATSEAWGGSSKVNRFNNIGATAATIWYGANDGADVVAAGFAADDKIKFYDKSIAELATAYTYNNGAVQFQSTANNADTLTVTGLVANSAITVLDKNNTAAKVVVGNNALTYAADAKVYMGAAATVTVGTTNDVFLYLGNGKDATYGDVFFSGVTQIDAATSTGKTVLCGAANTADTLTGGSNSSAMWGGGVANDDMVGHTSAVDQFWFGTGDGADVVSAGIDKGDTIVLHNITSIADVTMTVNAGAGTFAIAAKDGSTLSVTDAAAITAMDGGLTFQFGADTSAKSYTYNKVSKTFVAK